MIRGLCTAFAALCLVLASPAAQALEETTLPPEGEPLVVGCLYRLSGPGAEAGKAALAGTRLAARRINKAGGVLGRPLRLEVRDAAEGAMALDEAVAELAGQANATAFVGLLDGADAQTAGAETQARGLPFVCTGAMADALPGDVGPLFFTASFDNSAQAEALVSLAVQDLELDKAVLIIDPSRESWAGLGGRLSEALAARGVQTLTRLKLADQGGNAPALAREVQRYRGPALLVLASGAADAVKAVKAFQEGGLDWPVLCGAGLDAPGGAPALGEFSGTVYYAAHADYERPNELVRLFVKEYAAAEGESPSSGLPALGFDALAVLVRAVQEAGSAKAEAVAGALHGMSGYKGVTGSFTYGPDRQAPAKPVHVLERQGGATETAEESGAASNRTAVLDGEAAAEQDAP